LSAGKGGWTSAPLRDLCFRIVDGSHNPPRAVEQGVYMLSARNIAQRKINFEEYRFISKSDFAIENERTQVQPGDVLLTIVGAIGRMAVVPNGINPFSLQRSVAVLKPNGAILSRYLAYAIEAPEVQQFLRDNAKGTAQKGIYLKALGRLQLPLAPLAEQQRLANKLDTLLGSIDACRERLDRVPQILKKFREAVLEAAVSGKLTEEWREHNDTNETWPIYTVGEVASKVTDGEHITPKRVPSGKYLLSARNVQDGRIALHNVDYVDTEEFSRIRKRCDPSVGDVLLSCSGSVGRAALVDRNDCYVMVRSAAMIRPTTARLLSKYLMYSLQSPLLQDQIKAKSSATAQSNIFLGAIKSLTLPLPSIPEQSAIVHLVDELFQLAEGLERRSTDAVSLIDKLTPSVLAKAFRGELVPQDPQDEPAGEMLERIREQQTAGTMAAARRTKPPKGKAGRRLKIPGGRRLRASSG
jgi:type I restriction enzyme S subunit